MITSKERSAVDSLIDLMDTAIGRSASGATRACIAWLSGIPTIPSANEPRYAISESLPKRYRKSVKKIAIVRTIHSILSRKFQNALSEEVGPAAAWLLGLWPKALWLLGVKAVTPPHDSGHQLIRALEIGRASV